MEQRSSRRWRRIHHLSIRTPQRARCLSTWSLQKYLCTTNLCRVVCVVQLLRQSPNFSLAGGTAYSTLRSSAQSCRETPGVLNQQVPLTPFRESWAETRDAESFEELEYLRTGAPQTRYRSNLAVLKSPFSLSRSRSLSAVHGAHVPVISCSATKRSEARDSGPSTGIRSEPRWRLQNAMQEGCDKRKGFRRNDKSVLFVVTPSISE